MISLWFFIFFSLGVLPACQALTCTQNTDYTCTPSKYVTGRCVSGVCQCVDGTVPDHYGCHTVIKSNVTIFATAVELVSFKWSKEMRPGLVLLKCDPFIFQTVEWFFNGKKVVNDFDRLSDETFIAKASLFLFAMLDTGTRKFQCSVNAYGAQSEKSDAFVLEVRKPGEPFTEKPVLSGMPKSAAINASIKLRCENIPRFRGSFLFHINGKSIKETNPYMTLELTRERFNKPVTCSIVEEGTVQNVTSDPVYTPASPSHTKADVDLKRRSIYSSEASLIRPKKAIVGGYMSVVCNSQQTFSSSHDYQWSWTSRNGVIPLYYYTDNSIQLNNITAKDLNRWINCNSKSFYSSNQYISAIPMSTLIQPTLKVQSRVPGAYIFSCETDYDTPGMEYEWYVDDVKKISGRNNTFSFQQSLSLAANVKCRLLFNSDHSDYSRHCSIPGKGTIAIPEIEVEGSTDLFFQGVSYRLKCSCEEYVGASYSWKRGDQDLQVSTFHLDLTWNRKSYEHYTCTLKMGQQTMVSKSFEVVYRKLEPPVIKVVHGPPVKVVGGVIELQPRSTYYILCSSPLNNHENVNYIWESPAFGERVKITDKMLVLTDTHIAHSSNYTCSVEGIRSEPVVFLVMDPPRLYMGWGVYIVQRTAEVPKQENEASLIAGKNYSMVCDSRHFLADIRGSALKVHWMKNSETLKDLSLTSSFQFYLNPSVKTLSNVQENDSGEYSCEIKMSGHSIKSNTMTVTVTTEGKEKYCGGEINCTGKGFNQKCVMNCIGEEFKQRCVKGLCQCVDGQRCVPSQGNTTNHCPDGQQLDGQRCVPSQGTHIYQCGPTLALTVFGLWNLVAFFTP